MTLDRVLAFGFDKSFFDEDGYIRVRCSESIPPLPPKSWFEEWSK